MIKIKQGLDLPILGAPEHLIEPAKPARSVALIGFDYLGLKPAFQVKEGDRVRLGDVLFTDKKTPGVNFTAPAAGVVAAIHRGERRVFQSLVIDVEGDEAREFRYFTAEQLEQLDGQIARELLLESGLWTALRTRPFSKVPAADSTPRSVFVTAIDTHPLAANPAWIIDEQADAFRHGLLVLRSLAPVFLCKAPDVTLPGEALTGVQTESFAGPHPAGLVGTHIHFLQPVSNESVVWHIGYQDVIAIGQLFTSGRLHNQRIVSLAGPVVERPRLVRTQLGANLSELTAGQLTESNCRVISGSVFGGRTARGACDFLGRYHVQVSCLAEGNQRELMHYLRAGTEKHSVLNIFASKLAGAAKRFAFTTTTNGSPRAMVPVGNYEAIMPLDILPTQLLRSLIVGDTEMAQKLGCLELDEEDLALCSYVCAGKYEYGPILRDNLTRIEVEG